jgi:hypothetical protein
MKKLLILAAIAALLTACHSKNVSPLPSQGTQLIKNHALVVIFDNGKILTYDDKGIKPLFKHLDIYGNFKNAYIFDKVTGKASALVLAYGGAKKLYTGILSEEAIPVLNKYKIKYSADVTVPYIINVKKDGKCPMELTVANINTPEEAYKILKEKFNR